MCDFRNEIMQIDNVNSQSIEIDYILNQTSSTGLNCLEYLVVVIQTCPQNCSSCDSSLNCQTCIDTFYLYSDKTCNKCISGYFISGINCLACDSTCQTCSGSLSNNCLSCKTGFYLFDDNTCQNNCDTQNGFVISNNNCKACGSFCKTCQIQGDSSINCLTCLDGNYLLPNQTCNSCNIDQGFYIDGKNCLPCHNTCKTCSGSQLNNCLSCDSGSYLFDDSTCQQKCDTLNGFFILGLNCKKCDSSCKACQGKKDYCLSCFQDKYLFLDNSCNICQIDQGFYISGINCLSCHNTCKSCSGSQQNNCLSCLSGSYLFEDNTCQQFCYQKNGFFILDQNCKKCNSSCQTCSGSLSNNCLSCHQDFYLYDDYTCQNNCDTQNGFVISNNNCKDCSSFCKTCSIQSDSSINCLTCLDGNYLLPNKTCNTCKIDQGFYIDGKNCLPCHNTCKSCSGSQQNNCLSCDSGSYLFEDNTCKSSCDTQNGFFILGLNCKKCDSLCKTCQVDKNHCLSCKDGYSLKNNKCEQIYISYGSKSFGQQQVKYLEQNMSKTSSYSYIGTSFVSILQNILFKQSQAILISGFIYQKFSFILILETVLPQPVYISITSLKGKVFS